MAYIIDEIISKCKANGDGIYAFFFDHLSMDANRVLIVKNHEAVQVDITTEDGKHIKNDSIFKETVEFLMDSDSSYYGSVGFRHGLQILKEHFPGLKTYYCNTGWYTFPQKWMEIKEDGYYAKKCDELLEIIKYTDEQ